MSWAPWSPSRQGGRVGDGRPDDAGPRARRGDGSDRRSTRRPAASPGRTPGQRHGRGEDHDRHRLENTDISRETLDWFDAPFARRTQPATTSTVPDETKDADDARAHPVTVSCSRHPTRRTRPGTAKWSRLAVRMAAHRMSSAGRTGTGAVLPRSWGPSARRRARSARAATRRASALRAGSLRRRASRPRPGLAHPGQHLRTR